MSTLAMIFIGVCVAAGLFLILSVFLTPGTPEKSTYTNRGTRIFLLVLRLAIGWHLLVEGLEKFQDPSWTSQPYLHASTGPLGPYFRRVADHEFLEQFNAAKDDKKLPPALDEKWQRWFDTFKNKVLAEAIDLREKSIQAKIKDMETNPEKYAKHYRRTRVLQTAIAVGCGAVSSTTALATLHPQAVPTVKDQLAELKQSAANHREELEKLAEAKLAQAKARTLRWLTTPQKTRKPSPYLDRPAEMTAQQRLNYYEKLIDQADELAMQNLTSFGDGKRKELMVVYTEAQQFYGDLKNDLAEQTKSMKKDLQSIVPDPVMVRLKMPDTPPEPFSGKVLQIADLVVPWALMIIGGCLIAGLFTRLSSLAGAVLLLSFYLAMPPWPGFPTNPRAEGTYLFVNKTLIEMFALLVLATTATGRWLGLDAWLAGIGGMFRRRS